MGKHAKTYSTQAAYEADMENWEYPHLSLILESGGTLAYDESEPQPEPEPQSPLQFGATDYYCSDNMSTGDMTPSDCITLTYNGEPVYLEVPSDTVTFEGDILDVYGYAAIEPSNGCVVFNAYGTGEGTVTATYLDATATTTVHATMILPEE